MGILLRLIILKNMENFDSLKRTSPDDSSIIQKQDMDASAISMTVKLGRQELQILEVSIAFQFNDTFEEVVFLLEEVFSDHPEENL